MFARAHCLPTPPRGDAEYDESSLMLHALYACVSAGLGSHGMWRTSGVMCTCVYGGPQDARARAGVRGILTFSPLTSSPSRTRDWDSWNDFQDYECGEERTLEGAQRSDNLLLVVAQLDDCPVDGREPRGTRGSEVPQGGTPECSQAAQLGWLLQGRRMHRASGCS